MVVAFVDIRLVVHRQIEEFATTSAVTFAIVQDADGSARLLYDGDTGSTSGTWEPIRDQLLLG